MNLLNKKGIIRLSDTLEERHVLDALVSKALSNDDTPFGVKDIALAIGIAPAECAVALRGLHDRGIVVRHNYDPADWDKSTFKVTSFSVAVEPDQLGLPAMDPQDTSSVNGTARGTKSPKKQPPAKKKANTVAVGMSQDDRQSVESTVIGDRTYFVEVRKDSQDASAKALLFIESKLTSGTSDERKITVDGKEFADPSLAWAFADELLKGLAE